MTGDPTIELSFGAGDANKRTVTYNRGSGSQNLVFRYTVVDGDFDSNGINVVAGTVDLGQGGAIVDRGDNAATLGHDALGHDADHKVDAKGPTVTAVTISSTGPYGLGSIIKFDVTFDEPVTWGNVNPAIGFEVGGTALGDFYDPADQPANKGKGTDTVRFTHEVVSGTGSGDVTIPASPVKRVGGTTITDANGNEATEDGSILPEVLRHDDQVVDTDPPTVTAVAFEGTGSGAVRPYIEGSVARFVVTFSEQVTISTAQPEDETASLIINIGGDNHEAYLEGDGSASTTHTFLFRFVGNYLEDTDGISVPGPLSLNTATLVDARNNAPADGDTTEPGVQMTLAPGVALGDTSGHRVHPRVIISDSSAIIPQDSGVDRFGPGQQFRLIFLTSTNSGAVSEDIGTYNTFVQRAAADDDAMDGTPASVEPIREFSAQFRAVGSTSAIDAKDNTATYGDGVPIYWLTSDGSGDKVADTNGDFYDGSWDSEEGMNEAGAAHKTGQIYTGSKPDGTKHAKHLGNQVQPQDVKYGALTDSLTDAPAPLGSTDASIHTRVRSTSLPLYALSPIINVEDQTPPSVESVEILDKPADKDAFAIGDNIDVVVLWSEPVTITGPGLAQGFPQIALQYGANEVTDVWNASYNAQATADLQADNTVTDKERKTVFRYTVVEGNEDTDGLIFGGSRTILLSNTTIADANGNSATDSVDLDFDQITASTDNAVDGVKPTVGTILITSMGPYGVGQGTGNNSITFTAQFSETVEWSDSGTNDPEFRFRIGSATYAALYTSGEDSDTLTFTYTVANPLPNTREAISIPADPVHKTGADITDTSLNPAVLTKTATPVTDTDQDVNIEAPTISAVNIESTGAYVTDQKIRIKVTPNTGKKFVVTGTPQLALTVGTTTRQANYASTNTAGEMIFEYTVQAASADTDSNGISLNGTVVLNSGTISDDRGNVVDSAGLTFAAQNDVDYHEVNWEPDVVDITGNALVTEAMTNDAATGDITLRLLFVSSSTRDGTSSDIGDYNKHVQTAAAGSTIPGINAAAVAGPTVSAPGPAPTPSTPRPTPTLARPILRARWPRTG